MADGIVVKEPDEAERLAALRVFLRSFRNEGEAREVGLDHFIYVLESAGLARLRVAVDTGGRGGGSEAAGGNADASGSAVVGSGALICFADAAWIALMGVEPGHQKKGIGNAVMTELMNLARELGFATIKLDATNFGCGLYARHGFVDEYPAHMYEIETTCEPGAGGGAGAAGYAGSVGNIGEAGATAGRLKVRLDDAVPDWCLALDREAVGDDRSALFGAVLADGGKVLMVEGEGFGIMHGRKVGPVISRSIDAAVAIVRRADSFGASRIYVPHHDELNQDFLVGLKRIPPEWDLTCCTRMICGEPLKQNLKLEYAGYSAATG